MEFLTETEMECVAVVGDEALTKELLYHAINNEYEIDAVTLNPYDYDRGYITTISWNGDNYEVTVEEAYCEETDTFLVCSCPVFLQIDFEWKCEYIADVTHNKYVDADLQLVIVEDMMEFEIDDESEDDEEDFSHYSFANSYNDGEEWATVFVESNIKDFVDLVRDDYESVFEDD